MMNPWDSERTWQENGGRSAPGSSGSGLLWLVAIIIAVIGLAMMAKHGSNNVVAVPIGISLFFMVMFFFSHRREARRLAWKREVARLQDEYTRQQQIAAANPPRPAVDTTMRKVFDRYDLKVISHGRGLGWDPQRIASFLDYARDYVDTQHATALVNGNERGELDRHLEAALHKALLQYDMDHKSPPPIPF
ncbi:MAG: LapA family protein [Planctomycetes bacterium]|nr:LapA family protein [Planctomycetota bacterium]